MRLGGPLHEKFQDPEGWVRAVRNVGYRAAHCPVDETTDAATFNAYVDAARDADILLAEVGAWSNPISPDDAARKVAIEKCITKLDVAERAGVPCCVTIPGSRGEKWNGPHADNYSRATFDLIVQTCRQIIDAVKPKRTAFCLEMMGWGIPDSAETYLELIDAIDRQAFGVHFDPVNLIHSPRRYFDNANLIRHTVRLLAPHIRSVHAKDVLLHGNHLVHLDEVRPGLGILDYGVLLRELEAVNPELPLIMEHLPNAEEYLKAATYIREVAARQGVKL
ncbi:MAG: sugar phosphate isomerase/epimerase [Phycisphaeraceae bacterium]|nr:sugar phosphate isomerase/epimerase [Phycisphaeraceae bacterium]